MGSLVNLHTHSYHSDGIESPSDIVQLAAQSGIKLLALTDHDMTTGVAEAMAAGERLGVRVIPGAEISSRFHNKTIHILGYGIDTTNQKLQELLAHLREFRREQMIKKVREIVPDIDKFIAAQGEYFCPPKTASFLLKHRIAPTFADAWERIKNVKVAADDVQPEQVIATIHAAGGKAVLAHPFGPVIGISSISSNADEQKNLIKTLQAQGLDGMECYQLSHFVEDVPRALQLCEELGLMVTAGSDWHGPLHTKDENIKTVIPNYQEHFEDFTIPQDAAEKIIKQFTL